MRGTPERWWPFAAAALGAACLVLAPAGLRPSPGASAEAACPGAQALDLDCHVRRFDRLTRRAGAPVALATLRRERRDGGFVRAACHRLAHAVGRAAYARHGGLAGAYANGDRICSAGYHHGAVEAAVDDLGLLRARRDADGICRRLRTRRPRSQLHYNCAHGIGHGLMRELRGKLPEALEMCDALADRWERQGCYGGVFMHNVFAPAGAGGRPAYLRPAEPLYPCTAVARRHRRECYDEQIAYALAVRNDDFAEVFRLCARRADLASRRACFRGIGSKAAIHAHKQIVGVAAQAAAARALCLLGPGQGARSACVAGAVATIFRDYEGRAQAAALCRALARTRLHATCVAAERRWAVEVAR